ncbi:hypothetical protein FHR81_003488 [Actinoalloteichus hoggarensis]|uniref:Uncharacterized protein n=1 Tax=Actinoalloteichus hoggarensis TaxID=1470176 RepID=A0A221W7F7_9PSEU|nr:hypothetical protein [Actinoalloteichus hoggarensis]ASO21838.1 hypothetical protein AHOG_21110 [Actinoalloteichus hoggarensis]MBB5922436.1 hypothetical protein [Actinoalloteichus hoggarensis]
MVFGPADEFRSTEDFGSDERFTGAEPVGFADEFRPTERFGSGEEFGFDAGADSGEHGSANRALGDAGTDRG